MIPVTIAALLFSVGLMAQETSVTVKVEKDGKVVKDTTYIFEDDVQAEHALKMMDIICSDDEHMMKVHKSMAEHHGEHVKVMKYRVEDGEDVHVEHDGDHVKVMKYKIDGDEAHGKHVVVVKSGDGETFDILIDEEFEHEHGDKKIVTKEVTVIVSEEKKHKKQ